MEKEIDVSVSSVDQQDPLLRLFSAQIPNASPLAFRWDFGDGYSSASENITHRYKAPGGYQATLHYSIDGIPYTQSLMVDIPGDKSELHVKSHQLIILDSDNNDINQPYKSNDTNPQTITPPCHLSGILLNPNTCQAGKLCTQGDLIDRYTFQLRYGDSIEIEIIKGSLDLSISQQEPSTPLIFSEISSSLIIPATQLGNGRFNLDIKLNDQAEKAQYLLRIHQAAYNQNQNEKDFQPGKLIIQWSNSTQPELIDISDPRLNSVKGTSINTMKQRLLNQPEISSVSLNYIRRIQSSQPQSWPLMFQDINTLWEPLSISGIVPGGNTTVAVIDTGLYFAHPSFKSLKIRDGYDFISDPVNALDGDGWDANPEDPGDNQLSYHGTHVTGIIGAQSSALDLYPNANQGLASGTTIMPLRVLGADGGTSYDLIQALRFAAGLKNDSGLYPSRPADIINLSLGGIQFSAAEQATINEVINSGVIIVAATGNQGRAQVNYPAAYQNVIAVGALNHQGGVTSYSNYGQFIDLVAPGGECTDTLCINGINSSLATNRLRDSIDTRQPKWGSLAGTSMAAAHISGMLSLIRSHLPSLDSFAFSNLLKKGDLTSNIEKNVVTSGFNQLTGWGWLNSQKALNVINTSNLTAGGIWSTIKHLSLEPLQNIKLPLIVRGPEPAINLHLSNPSKNVNASLENNTLIISTNDTFHEPTLITLLSNNLHPLTISITPATSSQVDSNIHHLYLHAISKTGDSELGRATQKIDGWHAFIEQPTATIQASTDIDYDGVYCEPGELCALKHGGSQQNMIIINAELLSH